jgi:hypothetical protein
MRNVMHKVQFAAINLALDVMLAFARYRQAKPRSYGHNQIF